MPTAQRTIERLLREMNAAWLEGRLDDLGAFFADDMVLVPPGDHARLVGRAAVLESFRQHEEDGTEILVLAERPEGWRIVWRSQSTEAVSRR